ncbi:hypothetical protein RXV91_01030 [Lactiplantibacillus sp. DA1]|uniref:hypothetical protein n=1 Tax=Lactiplantibacillus sp. DA1 TaxID=3079857 RepID=UPI00292A6629|nr:hypothetical protein [Lactiplantibacillus sp. DA1]MDV0429465.1 hypothetical protein [Lactiplantibacillus sp. DA1]
MMSTNLTLLERKISNNLNCLYFVNHPVYRIQKDHQLVLAPEYGLAGNVTEIICDAQQRYHISFMARKEIVLTEKKVAKVTNNQLGQNTAQFLATLGYQLPTVQPLDDLTRPTMPALLPSLDDLTEFPTDYTIIDCEFGALFQRSDTAKSVNWHIIESPGLRASIFQLSAIGFSHHTQTAPFFNRYFDNPNFLPDKKLAGLTETVLTTTAYEAQGAPLTILKAFIRQVLQPQLPLVFWDQTQDMKHIHLLLTHYYHQLTATEQQIVSRPVKIFDAQAYTNILINRGNHKTGSHDLPLNGLAALFNISNPHQHNAIWDVQTTELVMIKLAELTHQAPVITSIPQAITLPNNVVSAEARTEHVRTSSPTSQRASYAQVHQLRERGKTYREIAAATGFSISGVNYILKKARSIVTHSESV